MGEQQPSNSHFRGWMKVYSLHRSSSLSSIREAMSLSQTPLVLLPSIAGPEIDADIDCVLHLCVWSDVPVRTRGSVTDRSRACLLDDPQPVFIPISQSSLLFHQDHFFAICASCSCKKNDLNTLNSPFDKLKG